MAAPTFESARSPVHRVLLEPALERLAALPMHLVPAVFLVGAAAFTFQQTLFFGYRFLGNSDRLNHYLSFILYHTHNLERGQFAAWSDFIYNGFDILSLPMGFFTPLYVIPALLHTDDVIAVFGLIAPALLAITLVEAYFVAYLFTHDRLAALAGACTYGCATYGLLKLLQSDQTYLSVLTAPAFFYLVHTTTSRNWSRRFLAMTGLAVIEFSFAFLQEFSYNLIFLGLYAAYLLLRRNAYPLVTFAPALAAGAALSLPRLLAQYATVAGLGRGRDAPVINDTVGLWTLFRFFSRDIFGHSWREHLQFPTAFQINLHEGDLVHSSVFGALLLALIIASCQWVFRPRSTARPALAQYGVVLVPYVVFVFAAMHIPRVYLLVARVYQNISFQHARIGVSALLPIALLSALYLAQGRGRLSRRAGLVAAAASGLVIVFSAFDFSTLSDRLQAPVYVACNNCLPHLTTGPLLTRDLVRFTLLTMLFGAIVLFGHLFGAPGRSAMKTVLAFSIVFQTISGAADYVEGPQTRDYVIPWETNDFVTARSDQFLPPTEPQMGQMQALLDNTDFRSVTVCSRLPNCSTTIGLSWGIRLMDGYSSGVPRRLAVLPDVRVEQNDIRFATAEGLPWRTLAFVNVRQAIQIDPRLYMNSGLELPGGVHLVENPSPYVYPRAYFASQTQAVDAQGDEKAVRDELNACASACPPGLLGGRFPVDYVEGGPTGSFDASGDLRWSGGGDRLTFELTPSPQPRFLVVNEMWAPGWSAEINGQATPVLPTNVAMRGVLVPAGASQVVLVYHSLLWWAWWYTPAAAAVIGLALFIVRRWTSTNRRQ